MIIKINNVNVHFRIWNENAQNTIVMLHGFTGSTATWEKVAYYLPKSLKIVAIDLIGHGLTNAPDQHFNYTMEEQIRILKEVFEQLHIENFTLLGYSMGGRVALSYITAFPGLVKQLILESASPGLKTEEEQIARRNSDELLANQIIESGLHAFVEKWENIPLFASQKSLPQEVQLAVRKERLQQTEIGLANSLRGMGTGAQQSLWPELEHIKIPVVLITGSLDRKFCQIAQEMENLIPNAEHILVNEVGHAIHVENPKQFATIVEDVLKK